MSPLSSIRVGIFKFFDKLLSELDIHVEEILYMYPYDEKLHAKIENIRKTCIEEIVKIKGINVKRYDQYLREDPCKFDGSMSFEEYCKKYFQNYCYIMFKSPKENLSVQYRFGILVVTDFYVSNDEIVLIE